MRFVASIACRALSCLLVLSSLASSQDRERFQPFASLAGSCWEGAFPDGTKDLHCWEWALDGAYLRDRHELQDAAKPYGGETFYGWDAEAGVLRFWYFNTLGGRSEGSVEKLDGEDRWLLRERYVGSTPEQGDESRLELRNFVVVEKDTYSVVTEQRDGSAWKKMTSIRFERRGTRP